MAGKNMVNRLHAALRPLRHLWRGIEVALLHLEARSLNDLRECAPECLFIS